jgi:hypothetical protein
MTSSELTFHNVDDLLGAHSRGRLPTSPGDADFNPKHLGPMLELILYKSDGRHGPLSTSSWLNRSGQRPLREALHGSSDEWYGDNQQQGFLRTCFDPLDDASVPVRTRFLMAARRAAERVSAMPGAIAQSLAAAIREMETNVYEHSSNAASGLLAFEARLESFEFVVADCGVGVLETLKLAPEYSNLRDHGTALQITLQEGASRYGKAANRGMGFKDLFVGLATLNADLRFRSGDHALTIAGPRPNAKIAQVSQKAFFPGFLVSVRCTLPVAARARS